MLISVIIPTYNYAQYIGEAVESVLCQHFEGEIEIIIVDDGSTDNTQEVLQKHKDKIQYIYQQNQGKGQATQTGIEAARGKYLFNLDADDFFMPDRVAEAVKIYETDTDIVHVAHPALFKFETENTETPEPVPADLLNRKLNGKELLKRFYTDRIFYGGGTTFSVRAETMKKIPIPAGVDMYTDEFLWLAVLNEGSSYFIDKNLSVARAHSQNFSRFIQDKNTIVRKQKRLIDSSAVLNTFVQNHPFDPEIKRLMTLTHAVREIAFEENYGTKTAWQIFSLWQKAFQIVKPGDKDFLKIIKKYTLLNRTLPAFLLKGLKKLKK
jgi:glycosyltransferase involved in cell wall biosynthesis